VTDLQHYLALYGYAALLPLAVVEGPAVTIIGAFLAARGILDVFAVFGLVVVADLIGDLMYYAAGRWMLWRLSTHTGQWTDRLRRRVAVLAPRIRARAAKMLLFGKLTHSAGFAVLLGAGAAHVPMGRFVGYNLLATLPKSLVLVALGYWFGQLYNQWQGDLSIAGVVAFLLAVAGLIFLTRRWLSVSDEHGT
jgi:membrane protein DedA with SNARE-associated domain